jgi:nucleotide-binding universal stress UspA family protein
MAIRDILLHIDTSEAGAGVDEFALSLAEQTGACIVAAGLAVQYLPSSAMDDGAGYGYLIEIAERAKGEALAAYERLKAAAPAGVSTDYVSIETVAQLAREKFGELGRHFDLSIVGQDSPEGGDDGLMIEGALFGSGRPVFVVPAGRRGPAKLRSAMVCWDGGLPATRALAGAMPLLRLAKRIEIVEVAKSGLPADELPGFNIARHFARHGLDVTLTKLPTAKDAGEALLAHAENTDADYLVMGAYGHWRLREFVLGGATRSALAHMRRPVLMAH